MASTHGTLDRRSDLLTEAQISGLDHVDEDQWDAGVKIMSHLPALLRRR